MEHVLRRKSCSQEKCNPVTVSVVRRKRNETSKYDDGCYVGKHLGFVMWCPLFAGSWTLFTPKWANLQFLFLRQRLDCAAISPVIGKELVHMPDCLFCSCNVFQLCAWLPVTGFAECPIVSLLCGHAIVVHVICYVSCFQTVTCSIQTIEFQHCLLPHKLVERYLPCTTKIGMVNRS